jgi:hypothetical protein
MHAETVLVRKPSAIAMVARIVVLTILSTLFCFAVGLLIGIIGISIANAVRGGGINLTHAYRNIAFPFAMVGLTAMLAALLVWEVPRYRRLRKQWRAGSGQ